MTSKFYDKITVPVILSILLIGAAIKFKFLFQGSLWPDEALYLYIARNLSADLTNLTDNSGNFFYHSPPLLMYLLSLVEWVRGIEFDQAARIVVILMGMGTVLTVYFIGKKIYHPLAGIVAALFMAVCPLSNWTGVRILNDVPVTFFIYLAVCMLVYEKNKAFYFFALCAALTKYSAILVFFLPLFMRMKPRTWTSLYLGGLAALFAFGLTSHFFPKPNGWLGYFYSFVHLPNTLHMVKETEFFIGYFIFAFAVLGMFLTIRERKFSALFHWICIYGICRIFFPWIIFRVSRYTLPLYPGIYLLAAYACYRSVQIVASKWPVYTKWAKLFFIVAIASVLFQHTVRSLGMLEQTRNMFTGFDKACAFLVKQPGPHSVATASPRQIKYHAPEFEVHDIWKNISPEGFKEFLEKEQIQYVSIDFWSPHLPDWCRSYDYRKNGYDLIYGEKNVYVFKALKKGFGTGR